MNRISGIVIAVAVIFTQITGASADEMNIKVAGWDADLGQLKTAAGTIINIDTKKVEIPATLSVGDDVLIEFNSSEDGFTGITSFTIINDN